MLKLRPDHELPECIKNWGWKYHHIGIPTTKIMPGERYIPNLKFLHINVHILVIM